MSKKLKIVHIASEVAPFSKTGGLADVARSLPKALKRLGHDVIVVTPLYSKLINVKKYNLEKIFVDVSLRLNSKETIKINYWKGYLMEGLPIYFVEYKRFFSKYKRIYGSSHENARFLVFNVATLKLLSLLKYSADIVHCHDWQTGLIPYYLKTDFRYSKTLKKAKTVFTIHNLIFQLGHNWWEIPLDKKDYGRKRIPHLNDPALEYINFSKRAILSADIINTVSEQYRNEIMTRRFGQDLHRILKNREKRVVGIVNGIDYNTYNPEKDENLYRNYSPFNDGKKIDNKIYLQKKLGLPVNKDIAMICSTSRIAYQKGFKLILSILPYLLKLDIQLVFLGDGDKNYIKELKKANKKYPQKLIWLPFKQSLETLLYAASDLFLLPSNHEPCGINQLIAMRYGAVPIIREVGGLYDTVDNFDARTGKGTGFTFREDDSIMLYTTIIRALENHKNHKTWTSLIKRDMRRSNSWEIPAKKYVELYKRILNPKKYDLD